MFISTWYLKRRRRDPNVCEGHLDQSGLRAQAPPLGNRNLSDTSTASRNYNASFRTKLRAASNLDEELGGSYQLATLTTLSNAAGLHAYTQLHPARSSEDTDRSSSPAGIVGSGLTSEEAVHGGPDEPLLPPSAAAVPLMATDLQKQAPTRDSETHQVLQSPPMPTLPAPTGEVGQLTDTDSPPERSARPTHASPQSTSTA
ncbi:hypothetical protein CALVIDRAFT_236944 [Calocera viscosa TUFC12733]|uniref:Uncharacterized protein n=1 Tax=Calocera viscosa (strain TUFC12733) TaxID=1330018 RepID=A0A167JU44_CALVF|nr:hypothetical protein CALVIDRAFT_236944 [Calocera viscosa TUFC12733]